MFGVKPRTKASHTSSQECCQFGPSLQTLRSKKLAGICDVWGGAIGKTLSQTKQVGLGNVLSLSLGHVKPLATTSSQQLLPATRPVLENFATKPQHQQVRSWSKVLAVRQRRNGKLKHVEDAWLLFSLAAPPLHAHAVCPAMWGRKVRQRARNSSWVEMRMRRAFEGRRPECIQEPTAPMDSQR